MCLLQMVTCSTCFVCSITVSLFVFVHWSESGEVEPRLLTAYAKASQSSTFQSKDGTLWSAEKVLDKCFNKSCIARTKGQTHSWIKLDLMNVYKITSVLIHVATAERCGTCFENTLKDYQLEMSKTTDISECVRTNIESDEGASSVNIQDADDGQPLPESRYITIRRHNQQLVIAEIEVFGDCPDNHCGRNCTELCFCKTPLTDFEKWEAGNCTGGCLDGFHGDKCDKITHPSYSSNCASGQYDTRTGECLGAKRECQLNFYGPSCQKRDSDPVLKSSSDVATDGNISTCAGATDGTKTLTFVHPSNLSHVDIVLERDSVIPLRNIYLEVLSPPGRPRLYPEIGRRIGCSNKQRFIFLSKEVNVSSLKVTSETFANICEVQFSDCCFGSFGPDCGSRCHCHNRDPCNTITGACPGRCEIGWVGNACNYTCSSGRFGENCSSSCNCLNDEPCHHLTGKCPRGCSDGWLRPSCNQPCQPGFHGKDCRAHCSPCKNGQACNHVNGSCLSDDVKDDPGHDKQDSHEDELVPEPDIHFTGTTHRADLSTPQQTDINCTDCEVHYKAGDHSSDDTSAAYGVLGASLVILIAVTTIAVIFVVRKRRDRLSKLMYSYVSNNDVLREIEDPITRNTPLAGQVHIVEAEVEQVMDPVDMEADVLDDAVLKIYDDDFVLDSDPNGPVPLAKLWSHIQKLRNDDDMLLKEFASLPIGICDSVVEAKKAENKKRNRYNGVYPYDFNRVKLRNGVTSLGGDSLPVYDNLQSDYINASYFDGYGREKAYIVTQGPLEWTRGDFWEMVWQEGTTQIVMLTNLIEDRKIKCSQYWPDDKKAHFGRISIKHVSSTSLPNFTVTQLQIRMGKDAEPHTVNHFHYQTWPDKNIPDSAWNLVDFWRHVRSARKDSDGPLVVHCSAGIGRSGTFIGLDYLYDQAMRRGYVRIFDCVRAMRKQRINMVQTKLQYLYLHEIVAEATHCGSRPLDVQVFQESVDELSKVDVKSSRTHMQIEYENLCEGIAISLSEEQEQIYANNRSLQVQALYLKNHNGEDRYLLEQSCYLGDDEEFWRNIYNTRSQTVVTFENLGVKDTYQGELSWLETGVPKQVGDLELLQTSEDVVHSSDGVKDIFSRRVLSIKLQDEEPHLVHVFEGIFWEGEELVFGPKEILSFIDTVMEWYMGLPKTDVIVLQYGDDPSRLGPFLVIFDELDRCNQKNKIGLFETVWRFKSIFPNMIPDFQQYLLCYTALADRQKASTTYYNM